MVSNATPFTVPFFCAKRIIEVKAENSSRNIFFLIAKNFCYENILTIWQRQLKALALMLIKVNKARSLKESFSDGINKLEIERDLNFYLP
jgi:hypothetical protein